MNEETMTTTMEILRHTEPVYAHLLGEFRGEHGNRATLERSLKQLKEKIKKRGEAVQREAASHAAWMRKAGTDAHAKVLALSLALNEAGPDVTEVELVS